MICLSDARGVTGYLRHKIQHESILIGYLRGSIISLQVFYQPLIESDATQKLCVGLDSIMTAVGD
jgi:hypothetical protein